MDKRFEEPNHQTGQENKLVDKRLGLASVCFLVGWHHGPIEELRPLTESNEIGLG